MQNILIAGENNKQQAVAMNNDAREYIVSAPVARLGNSHRYLSRYLHL
jgi:hypothetical protein